MRTWMLAPLVALHLALAGCEPPGPIVPPGAPVVVQPMKLMQKNVSPEAKLIELAADGTISGPNGEFIGKLAGTKITDHAGKELVSIAPDGTIVSTETKRAVKFTPEGYLSDEKGLIKIGSDGTVITQEPAGDPTRTNIRFNPYTPVGQRAGGMILVLVSKHIGKVADLGLNPE